MSQMICMINQHTTPCKGATKWVGKISPVDYLNLDQKTSLKIFKHYKLKPSFSIIKDEKAKDKVGLGDKPPPPSFNNFNQLDQV